MELLYLMLGGAILGLAGHYGLPGRDTRGVILVPAIGAAASSIVVVALTWAGWRYDGGWIWVVSLAAAVAVVAGTTVLLGRRRGSADAELLARLNGA